MMGDQEERCSLQQRVERVLELWTVLAWVLMGKPISVAVLMIKRN